MKSMRSSTRRRMRGVLVHRLTRAQQRELVKELRARGMAASPSPRERARKPKIHYRPPSDSGWMHSACNLVQDSWHTKRGHPAKLTVILNDVTCRKCRQSYEYRRDKRAERRARRTRAPNENVVKAEDLNAWIESLPPGPRVNAYLPEYERPTYLSPLAPTSEPHGGETN
jgi:hypothetical protein